MSRDFLLKSSKRRSGEAHTAPKASFSIPLRKKGSFHISLPFYEFYLNLSKKIRGIQHHRVKPRLFISFSNGISILTETEEKRRKKTLRVPRFPDSSLDKGGKDFRLQSSLPTFSSPTGSQKMIRRLANHQPSWETRSFWLIRTL